MVSVLCLVHDFYSLRCSKIFHVCVLHFKAGGYTRQPNLALVFMAALGYRAGHYIFALWFLSFFLFFLA